MRQDFQYLQATRHMLIIIGFSVVLDWKDTSQLILKQEYLHKRNITSNRSLNVHMYQISYFICYKKVLNS